MTPFPHMSQRGCSLRLEWPHLKSKQADVAQLVEQPIRNRQVSGSTPLVGSSIHAGLSKIVSPAYPITYPNFQKASACQREILMTDRRDARHASPLFQPPAQLSTRHSPLRFERRVSVVVDGNKP
jgi:hypothetical protein